MLEARGGKGADRVIVDERKREARLRGWGWAGGVTAAAGSLRARGAFLLGEYVSGTAE